MATSGKVKVIRNSAANAGFSVRLKEERARLKLNQEEFGRLGGVGKIAQLNYEKASRSPTVEYLFALEDSKAGVDVGYLVSGVRNAQIHAAGGSLDHQLLTGAVSVIASLAEGCAVKMSASELSAMAATLYRGAIAGGTLDMTDDQVTVYLDGAATSLFAGWLIGRGADVPGFNHPEAPSSSIP